MQEKRYFCRNCEGVHKFTERAETVDGENLQQQIPGGLTLKYNAEKNYEQKKKNLELIKEAHKLRPNKTSEKLLKQAESDLLFAIDMLKKND